ncbi:unnamed protein product [Ilex paraguariensis]|uniref:Uncharacterized protein n=1 Tax=Ilex paraguariensis TaxID=185542 RepID=A0ABC8RIS3_9AQUA
MKKKEAKRKWGEKVGIFEFSNQEVKKNMKMFRLELGRWDHYLEIPAKFEDHLKEALNGIQKMYNLKKLKETLEESDQFNDHTKGDCEWMNKLNVKWKDCDRSVLSIVLDDVEDKEVMKNDVNEKQKRLISWMKNLRP